MAYGHRSFGHRTHSAILQWLLLLLVNVCQCSGTTPVIESIRLLNNDSESGVDSSGVLLLLLTGANFHGAMLLKPTVFRYDKCESDDSVKRIWINDTSAVYEMTVAPDTVEHGDRVYFCVGDENQHVHHQPESVYVDVYRTKAVSSITDQRDSNHGRIAPIKPRVRRRAFYGSSSSERGFPDYTDNSGTSMSFDKPSSREQTTASLIRQDKPLFNGVTGDSRYTDWVPDSTRVYGVRIYSAGRLPDFEDGCQSVLVGEQVEVGLFGVGLRENMEIVFTEEEGHPGGPCLLPSTTPAKILKLATEHSAVIMTKFPRDLEERHGFYPCLKQGAHPNASLEERQYFAGQPFVHQGVSTALGVRTHERMLADWVSLLIIGLCLSFSALFSGLNLGLMSLDRTELKILCNTGTHTERKHANTIKPVREKGNYLLCSILLGNVLVNSVFTILLDDLTSGVVAVISSTLLIVVFGEITPQAICSRHGLAVGAKTIYITKLVMLITLPLAWPISKLLDYILGEEIGNVYNRERLKELVRVTTDINDLDKDEVNIISGALELRKKTVKDVMTPLEDIFMLDMNSTVLDFETVSEIMKSGYSRIPVYEDRRSNIVAILYMKDLAFVDPDDNTPLKTLCTFYQNPTNFVFEDLTLDNMFKCFKEGNKGHMAFITRVNNEGEGDPFYETIGLVTLEDVIEEIIQAEIMDETDVFTDNRSKRKRKECRNMKQDFTIFAERKDAQQARISPQLTLATFQYLNSTVKPFQSENISETILRRLLRQDIYNHIKYKKDIPERNIIYQQGKSVDFFVLILEGRVEVVIGQENLLFESGPFTYFGIQALVQNIGIAESPTGQSQLGSIQSVNMDALMRASFVPDYTVKAITDVLYAKIPHTLYHNAKRATLMERSQHGASKMSREAFDDEVEKLLHSTEDDGSLGRVSPATSAGCDNELTSHRRSTTDHSLVQSFSQNSLSDNPNATSFSHNDLNGSLKIRKPARVSPTSPATEANDTRVSPVTNDIKQAAANVKTNDKYIKDRSNAAVKVNEEDITLLPCINEKS